MAQGYIRIQIDFAHFRAQLTPQLALAGILEINIGTVLIPKYGILAEKRLTGCFLLGYQIEAYRAWKGVLPGGNSGV